MWRFRELAFRPAFSTVHMVWNGGHFGNRLLQMKPGKCFDSGGEGWTEKRGSWFLCPCYWVRLEVTLSHGTSKSQMCWSRFGCVCAGNTEGRLALVRKQCTNTFTTSSDHLANQMHWLEGSGGPSTLCATIVDHGISFGIFRVRAHTVLQKIRGSWDVDGRFNGWWTNFGSSAEMLRVVTAFVVFFWVSIFLLFTGMCIESFQFMEFPFLQKLRIASN